jgi:acetolactate synthase I/II/III large subunit
MKMATCGEVLLRLLEAYGVEVVFGIPGVHTVELYRGLPATRIWHVAPRHEQGAGFMADGYARVNGKPGVCFIITGPGMTNILTAMGQAYADSVPMLVISSVNRTEHLGMGQGRLHELPSQRNVVAGVAAALEVGHVWINSPQVVFMETSWGGFKRSGIGRELGPWGLSRRFWR